MRSIQRPHAIILGALLILLFTTSPAWPVAAPAPRLPAANASQIPTPRATALSAAAPSATAPLATQRVPGPVPPTRTPLVIPTPGVALTPIGQTLDRYLSDLVQAGLFQGSVLVARDGQIIIDKGYGYANVARAEPNTSATRFQIASMTKQFTAVAVLQLVARGQLALNDPVCSYLADCPATWRAITIAQLLSHRSGLPNYTDYASFEATQMLPTTPAELVSRFRDQPLLFTPGTGYMYENSDYVLLGMVIEKVTGRPYAEVLQTGIFEPLGMHDTGADTDNQPGRAQGYHLSGELAPPLDPSTLFAAGALHSTTHDLLRWDQALYTDQLLPPEMRDLMWQPNQGKYGYGWLLGNRGGHLVISHPGLMDGFASVIARYPDERLTVIVLGNMSAADPEGIAGYLADLVFGSG